ncbi:putative Zn finger protein [Streptomyces sp. V3I8]|uniref:SWF or SNF family helicase n=1 Tax=Streptomyces sp. V3I8 TaxID=3042279 RepID=UPI0027848CCD|nr:SWF or SNF family helicase [Streptomyces sp. V3I8]MDQ1040401.1 putative Zn finger protein [Streptomyces sp. V3I8]
MSDPYENTPERTFAALPPARGRGFAQRWWGQAWLRALEDAALDSEQLRVGRRLARAGAVGAVSVRPGRVTAVVQDRDRTAHRADVLLQELSGEQWDRFLGMAVERAGHIAALLDREMPPHLVEDAASAGIELLPGLGDLEAECDCDAWDHCGHTAALCYQVARLLDQDPFVLLLLRGRGERELLDEVQRHSVSRSATGTGTGTAAVRQDAQEGVDAAGAYAAGDILPSLPGAPAVPPEPGLPPSLDTETAPAPGVDPAALEFLAAQAAREAYRLLVDALAADHEQRAPETGLTPAQDAVRLASGRPDAASADRLAKGSGRDREGLALAVRAWEYGGAAALDVLEADRPAQTYARARAALESAWEDDERPALHAARNRWTTADGRIQLRPGPDGRWWPYRKERGRWAPAGPAAQDPATALALAEGQE